MVNIACLAMPLFVYLADPVLYVFDLITAHAVISAKSSTVKQFFSPESVTFFHGDLIIKYFLGSFSPFS